MIISTPAGFPRPTTAPVSLATLLPVAAPLRIHGDLDEVRISGITHDSRSVVAGDLYCAFGGSNAHGAEFLDAVVAAGVHAVLTDEAGEQRSRATGLPTVVVGDVRAVMGRVAAEVYGRPAERLRMIGITGTNGKTTTAAMIEASMRAEGRTAGSIGTIATTIGDEVLPSVRTTPESTDLHALLAVMVERAVSDVVMEVSSHALVMGRVDGVEFDIVGFTNLSQDHLDFHGDMGEYFAAKASLFTADRARQAVVCVDDTWGQRLAARVTLPSTTVTTHLDGADWCLQDRATSSDASRQVRFATTPAAAPGASVGSESITVTVNGAVNEQNAAVAIAICRLAGVSDVAIEQGISGLHVRGRMERVVDEGVQVYVDYAHTPEAIDAVVRGVGGGDAAALPVVVVGAGGDRDPGKRAAMGRAAARWSSVVIVTDDNPRTEDPALIRSAVAGGARDEAVASGARVEEIGDRAAAIARGIALAAEGGGALLVLGKGHEQGQEIAGVMHPFDDRTVVEVAYQAWQGSKA